MITENNTFEVKKTNELNKEEINQINQLFNNSFQKILSKKRSLDDFYNKFSNNFFKFSFHGMMKSNNKVIGSYNVIPNEFNFFSQKKIFGLSVDTAIEEKFRGNIFNLKKLANTVYDELKNYNIAFVYGLANNSFYLVKKKVLGWKDIGRLNYYVSPINFKKKLINSKFLNFITIKTINLLSRLNQNNKYKNFYINKIDKYLIKKDIKDYSNYEIIDNKSIFGIIKFKKYKKKFNLNTAYIIDIAPQTIDAFDILNKILIKKYPDLEIVIYFGNLNFVPKNFFLLPSFINTKQNIFSGKVLENSLPEEKIFNISNWNINSSNFDIF